MQGHPWYHPNLPSQPCCPAAPLLGRTQLPTSPLAAELEARALGCCGGQAKLPGESILWPQGERPWGDACPSLGESISELWGEHLSASRRASPSGIASLGHGESISGGIHRSALGRASLGLRESIPWGKHPLASGTASLPLGESMSQGTHPSASEKASLGVSIPWGEHPLGKASLTRALPASSRGSGEGDHLTLGVTGSKDVLAVVCNERHKY